jgi:hypothetical protein
MATGSHKTNVDAAGNPVRVVTNAGVDSSAEQQVVTLADKNGVLRGAADTVTQMSVAAAITTNTLLAANANRQGATIWNDSTSILYVRLGTFGASATTATVKMVPDAYYELPFDYTGAVQGIWVTANGAARITELT